MADWLDKKVDAWFDRRVDRYVDKKLDSFLVGHVSEQDLEQLKAMTRKGEPLDAATEARLQGQLGAAFEPYKAVHNGVARFERIERAVNKVTGLIP